MDSSNECHALDNIIYSQLCRCSIIPIHHYESYDSLGQWHSRWLALYSQPIGVYKLDYLGWGGEGVGQRNYNDNPRCTSEWRCKFHLFLWLQSIVLKMQMFIIFGLRGSVNKLYVIALCYMDRTISCSFHGIYVQTVKCWSGCWVETHALEPNINRGLYSPFTTYHILTVTNNISLVWPSYSCQQLPSSVSTDSEQ